MGRHVLFPQGSCWRGCKVPELGVTGSTEHAGHLMEHQHAELGGDLEDRGGGRMQRRFG